MTPKLTNNTSQGQVAADALRSWVMVVLTLIFVILYGAALIGWLKPLADEKMIARLEPIIFVIIGYYFGRLPAQQNEQTLKDEITRQTQKADAAQHAKEQVQQTRETLEERVKNAHSALASVAQSVSAKGAAEHLDKADGSSREEALRASRSAALKILSS
jgi:hypothetical protein